MISCILGRGTRSSGVRSVARLRETKTSNLSSVHEGGNIFLFKSITGKIFQRPKIEAVMGAHDHSCTGTTSTNLCQSHSIGQCVQTSAPILLSLVYSHQPQIPHFVTNILRKLTRFVCFAGNWPQLCLGKLPAGVL